MKVADQLFIKTESFVIAILMVFGLSGSTQAQTGTPTKNRLVISSEQLSDTQRLLDEQSARGYVVSGISYHSSIKNLHTNGRLEIDLEMLERPGPRQYRALIAEKDVAVLQKALNYDGAKGFRLLVQTPIPFEVGFVRPRDMFLAVMEKTAIRPGRYEYRVIAYRHKAWVQQQIKQGVTDGFTEACKHQFGPVVYLVMEKMTANSP